MLLVVCTEPHTARWCARPIVTGHPRWDLTPVVLPLSEIPMIAGTEAVPELMMLSAIANADHPELTLTLDRLQASLSGAMNRREALYFDVLDTTLTRITQSDVETDVNIPGRSYDYWSPTVRKFVNQGRAEGKADALLTILDLRGIKVPDGVRERFASCDDLEQLGEWIGRAATADALEEVLV
jgi:hypothetical protein